MTFRRRLLLVGTLLGITGLILLVLAQLTPREEENYSLIEDGLYMGGDVDAPPPGTRAVLNLCEKDDPYRTEVYAWEAIPDAAPAPDLDWLRRQVDWVDARRRAGVPTFVHCRAGVSRSGMVVTAYEMAKNHWTRDEALAFVRSKRPLVRPNPAFMERLLEWEGVLKGEPSNGEPPGSPGG
jgi:Dual specificity phosphatase, catalytic domain